ncbi:MAG: radical SAM protein [Elusimicrobia bacterium]|nr:MAG: radical SAM protein [Elusimicrobiota bacterium]
MREAVKKFNWPPPGSPVKGVELLVGEGCNARCLFCCSASPRAAGAWRPWREICADLARARSRGAWLASFSGGEAALHPDIFRILRSAAKLGFSFIQIITNGLRFADGEFAAGAAAAGANEIKISLHARDAATHDRTVGVRGAFSKALRAIENCSALGLKVSANFAVTKLNYRQLPAFTKFMAEDLRLTGFCFMFSFYEGRMLGGGKKLRVSYSAALPYLRKALKYMEKEGIRPETKMLSNFTPCLAPEYSNLMSDWGAGEQEKDSPVLQARPGEAAAVARHSSRKKKTQACAACVYRKICYGVDDGYLRSFGESEFKPLAVKPSAFPLRPFYP